MKILLDEPPIKRRTGKIAIILVMIFQMGCLLRLADGTLEVIASIIFPIVFAILLNAAWSILTKKYW